MAQKQHGATARHQAQGRQMWYRMTVLVIGLVLALTTVNGWFSWEIPEELLPKRTLADEVGDRMLLITLAIISIYMVYTAVSPKPLPRLVEFVGYICFIFSGYLVLFGVIYLFFSYPY